MFMINDVLSDVEVTALRNHLEENNQSFEDGKKTAGWAAKDVKQNQQLAAEAASGALAKVEAALLRSPLFMAAARPKAFVKMLVSRYTPGMSYGLHVDDAVMGGVRTDLSFTLFLSDPATYEGGALTLEGHDGTTEIKPQAGALFLYATKSLHRVEPVMSGERLAIVGWVRSLIRSDEHREVLFDLEQAVASARANNVDADNLNRLLKIRNNLLRLWAED